MRHRGPLSVRLWLVAVLFGLSGLLLAGAAQQGGASTDVFHKDALSADVWQHASVLSGGTDAFTPGHLQRVSHVLPRTSLAATPVRTASIVAPAFAGNLPVREHVAALAPAPRASGPSRAPPAA
jgi:hypothetical protein